jgi:hypothetical protein
MLSSQSRCSFHNSCSNNLPQTTIGENNPNGS